MCFKTLLHTHNTGDVFNGLNKLDANAGGRQVNDVALALVHTKMFEDVEVVSDLAGHKRFIKAFRTAACLTRRLT